MIIIICAIFKNCAGHGSKVIRYQIRPNTKIEIKIEINNGFS